MNLLLKTVVSLTWMEQMSQITEMMLRFGINLLISVFIIHVLYYRKSQRKDYYFTFMIISACIFFMVFLLGGIKLKIGFALGLFAVFGIIRYRTEQVPIREMTYLFITITTAVINALACDFSYVQLVLVNLILLAGVWILESNRWVKHRSTKLIQYDRIDLIKPEDREELILDLQERTGLNVEKVEVGYIDFLRDSAMLKVYYMPMSNEVNTIDNVVKYKPEEESK
jgi:hypothetical protein